MESGHQKEEELLGAERGTSEGDFEKGKENNTLQFFPMGCEHQVDIARTFQQSAQDSNTRRPYQENGYPFLSPVEAEDILPSTNPSTLSGATSTLSSPLCLLSSASIHEHSVPTWKIHNRKAKYEKCNG